MILRLVGVSLCLLMAGYAVAETTETLDLATPITQRDVSASEPVKIVIIHMLPGKRYRVKTAIRDIEILPLDWPPAGTSAAALPAAPDKCATLADDFVKRLKGVTQEEQVPSEIAHFRRVAQTEGCSEPQVSALELAISSTTMVVDQAFRLQEGQELTVSVERDDRSWKYVLSTGARGEWRTFYGFNFLPNEDEEYFSSQDPDNPQNFTITRKADREDLDFAPSVIFTWLPASQRQRDWGHGLAVGLGFDLDNPVVFGGYALTYNQNIAITGGLMFHKQNRLDGRFNEGQIITENLDSNQLTEETYDLNFYIGIGFRFGSNIFDTSGNN